MDEYLRVLSGIKKESKTFQSNYVRNNASLVAELASRSHISCLDTAGRNTGVWQATASGVAFLRKHRATV